MPAGLDDDDHAQADVNSSTHSDGPASAIRALSATPPRTDHYAARLEADLAAMRRLYDLQAKLAFETDLKVALGEIVAASADFTRTDRGCVQLVSEDGERLEMFVHRGYGPESGFIRHFLREGSKPACDAARKHQQRTIIDDVATFPALLDTEDRRVALADDIRATQSTPMISRKGELVGVLSNQFRQPHRPSDNELKLIDMLAWTAADFVDRHLTEAALRRANDVRQRQTLEIETVPVVFFDLVGGITDANDAFLELIGYTRAELEAGEVRYENLTPPDWAWRDEQTIAELKSTGKSKPFEKEYFRRDGSRMWIHCTGKMLDEDTAIEFIIDVTERKRVEEALRESEGRFRTLMEGIPQLVWRAVDQGRWTWASPQWSAFTGQVEPASHGMGWLGTIDPDDRPAALAAWERAVETGGFDVDYRVCRADGSFAWFTTRATPVRDEHGLIVEWLGTSTEVQALRELQERQGVLVAELQHRTRNLIAVVRSLAGKTADGADSLDDFKQRFGTRLAALSRVQGLLSQLTSGQRVAFDDLLKSELNAHGALGDGKDKVTLEGPAAVFLRSATVQTLALAIHELTTNATKYGAFSTPAGHLDVRWHVEAEGEKRNLHVDWRESGVAMPGEDEFFHGSGYGRRLIERALPYQLNAKTTYELGADGVHCTILVPIASGET